MGVSWTILDGPLICHRWVIALVMEIEKQTYKSAQKQNDLGSGLWYFVEVWMCHGCIIDNLGWAFDMPYMGHSIVHGEKKLTKANKSGTIRVVDHGILLGLLLCSH